jgi:hypothetical protein
MAGVFYFGKLMRASYAERWLSNQKEEKRRSHPDSWDVSITFFSGVAIRSLYGYPTLL